MVLPGNKNTHTHTTAIKRQRSFSAFRVPYASPTGKKERERKKDVVPVQNNTANEIILNRTLNGRTDGLIIYYSKSGLHEAT